MRRAAGVAGLAACLALGGPAAAEPTVNWAALARCESDGDWSADTGNGFYGGLQISEATWRANGGTGTPAQASPAAQIAVARRILARQGAGAWPTCSSHGRPRSRAPVGSTTHFLMYLADQAAAALDG